MDVPSRPSVSQGILSRSSGLSPERVINVDAQRQQAFGMTKNQRLPSRDHAQMSSKFAKLWHDRLLSRKTAIHKEFQAKATFKKAIKKIVSALKVVNVFLSCSPNSDSHTQHDAFRYFIDIMDMSGNHVSDEGASRHDANSPTPLFDPAWFKANREIRLSSETKAILNQVPNTRTPEQVQTVFRSLHTLPSFVEYPLYHQKAICQDASYQSFPPNVTILQQGHRADNFYFVLSGSATVISKQSLDGESDTENGNESVSVIKRGMAFGEASEFISLICTCSIPEQRHQLDSILQETEIMTNSLRNATVISKTHIELLVVSKEDYAKIFFGADSQSGKKEYISFLRTVDFLQDWPVDILESYPDQSQHCYFRRGTVIVRNSNSSQWLYVVKSGVCEVLIRLNAVKPRKAIGRNVRELSSLEALTKITMERRQDSRNRKKNKINFPSVGRKEETVVLPNERFRRKTFCYVPELGLVNSHTISQRESTQPKINPIAEDDSFPDLNNDEIDTVHSSKSTSTTAPSFSGRRLPSEFPRIKLNSALASTRRKSRTVSVIDVKELSNSFPKRTRSFSLPSTTISSEFAKLSRTKTAFVQIDLLHPKRVFRQSETNDFDTKENASGLSELDFEYNALHSGRPANVSLVSRGAECIMISKKFFMEHANALTKRWIRLNVQPYLPTVCHQQTLQEKIDWDAFKRKLVSSVVKESS